MPAIVVVLMGFGAGLLTMAIVSLYKWALEVFNGGFN